MLACRLVGACPLGQELSGPVTFVVPLPPSTPSSAAVCAFTKADDDGLTPWVAVPAERVAVADGRARVSGISALCYVAVGVDSPAFLAAQAQAEEDARNKLDAAVKAAEAAAKAAERAETAEDAAKFAAQSQLHANEATAAAVQIAAAEREAEHALSGVLGAVGLDDESAADVKVAAAAASAARANYARASLWQTLARLLSGGKYLVRNVRKPIAQADGGDPLYVVDALIVPQGPNYALAKRMQHWRAMVARQCCMRFARA